MEEIMQIIPVISDIPKMSIFGANYDEAPLIPEEGIKSESHAKFVVNHRDGTQWHIYVVHRKDGSTQQLIQFDGYTVAFMATGERIVFASISKEPVDVDTNEPLRPYISIVFESRRERRTEHIFLSEPHVRVGVN